jgi:hypothetical protein
MRVALIFPRFPLAEEAAKRCVKSTRERFARRFPMLDLRILAGKEEIGHYRSVLKGETIELFEEGGLADEDAVLVFAVWYDAPSQEVSPRPEQRIYQFYVQSHQRLGKNPFELIWPKAYDEFENPFIESHVFNRLSGRKWGFVNFPYGCLYMDSESGPVDPFGFRIDHDWRQWRDRPPEVKLVVSFGGSAAFSCFCSYDEMFTTRLEQFLNDHMAAKGARTRFKVLNFGMHDNVVMQEMLTYMLHVWSLKPDVIITHDGHNDLWYGLTDDSFLVNQYDIIYQRHSEQWSKKIHDTEKLPSPSIVSCSVDGIELNLPQRVIEAYVTRKRQFKEVAEARGAKFLWGLQPLITSKGRLSPLEKSIQDSIFSVWFNSPGGQFYRRILQAYDMLAEVVNGLSGIDLVDMNACFKQYGDDLDLMWDHVHCSPLGDELIARRYLQAVLEVLGPGELP